MRRPVLSLGLAAGGWLGYRMLAAGAITVDTALAAERASSGRSPGKSKHFASSSSDIIATPYWIERPRALASKLEVWERGSDMVLAAHFTEVKGRTTTTVETVRFDRPERIDFRLVRRPVPHVTESFVLNETDTGTRLTWHGELGTTSGPSARGGVIVSRSPGKRRCGSRFERSAPKRNDARNRGLSRSSIQRTANLTPDLRITASTDSSRPELIDARLNHNP